MWEIIILILIIIILLIWIFFRGYFFPPEFPEEKFPEEEEEELKEEEKEPLLKKEKKFASIGEKVCYEIYEEYVGYEVHNNIRPKFLRNPETGYPLQYDIYDGKKKIAIEYNGEQHYVFPSKWIKSKKLFDDLLYRDKLKEKLSKDNGIFLITVPYTVDTMDDNGKYKRYTEQERKEKIKSFLMPILNNNVV